MEDPARRLAGIGAPGSRGESGRPFGGAVQGSAAAVSGRVSFLSGTKLDCGRLSVESGWDKEKRASTNVQQQIPHHHPSIPARLVSPEQSREDCDSGAVQVLKSKRCRDTKPSCPYNCTEFGHVVQESSNEGTSLVDDPEHFRVPGQ